MPKIVDQHGERIPRISKSGIRKALMEPVKGTSEQHFRDFAMVRCLERDIYITRMGKEQRSCRFHVSFWQRDQEYAGWFDFEDRDEAIEIFIKKIKVADVAETDD